MKSIMKYFATLLLLFLLTNCSASFFTLNPDEESSLEQGRRVIDKETDYVYSSLSLEDQTEGEYLLNFYVYNKGDEEILVDPKLIYYKVYNKNRKLLSNQKHYAFNPEDQIKNLNTEIDDREDEHDVNTGMNIAFSLISTIVDLTDDEDDDAEEVVENIAIFAGNQVGEEIDYGNDIDNLEDQKEFWKHEVLRVTEISKDEEIGGLIFIPLIPDATYIKIYVPLGNELHTYKFKQIEE